MEPRRSSVSPLRTRERSRTLGLRKTTHGSRSGRSNGWAECREKKIGIEPMGSTFFLTSPLIGRIVTGLKLKHTRMTCTIIAEHTHELARPSLNTPAIPFDRTCNLRSQRRRRRDRRHLAKVLLRASL